MSRSSSSTSHGPRHRVALRSGRLLTLLLGLTLAGACADSSGPRAGSFTNWFSGCEDDAACRGAAECMIGYCTLGCSDTDPCPGEATSCLSLAEGEGAALFATPPEPLPRGVCVATCASLEDCEPPLVCRRGACLPACDADGDDDGSCDAHDTCPAVADVEQLDTDGDGIGDACDLCPAVSDAEQAPYGGAPVALPARIELEDYDLGGECVAYHDEDALHDGETLAGYDYRLDEAVDVHGDQVETAGDHLVGFTLPGEWLEYTIAVPEAGAYDFELRYAKGDSVGTALLELDDRTLGRFDLVLTPSFGEFTSAWLRGVELPARERAVLRLQFESGYTNYSYVEVTLP